VPALSVRASSFVGGRRIALPWLLVTTGLCFASYTTSGYQYQIWPQFFLEFVLRYSDRLVGDWTTSLGNPHWAFSHALAVVPVSLLSSVVFVLWLLSLGIVWLAFAAVCRAFGLSWPSVLGAGLVAASTGFAGLGLSRPLSGFLYPTEFSFGLVVVALAAVLYAKPVLVGLALGLAILIHPDMGVLGVLVVLPALAATTPLRPVRRHLPLALALVIPASPAFYEAFANLALGSSLPEHRRYELIALVRAPWHFLYRAFPAAEWAMVGGWLLVLVVSFSFLPGDRPRRVLGATALSCGVVCTLGAIASQIGRPLLLVQLQTARLTSLLVLLGIVAGFAAVHRFVGRWTGVVGVLVFLLTPVIQNTFLGLHHLPVRIARVLSTSSVSAGVVFVVVCVLAWAFRRETIGERAMRGEAVAFACLTLVAALTLGLAFQNTWLTNRTMSQTQQDWITIAKDARTVSRPRDVFLVPPAGPDLFPLWSYRPVVVSFSAFEFGEGDNQWVRRISIVTGGDPQVFDPVSGTGAAQQAQIVESAYDRTVATSRRPICAFGARFAVIESSVTPPAWLERIDSTSTYDLYKVQPGTCGRA
jgi:hypothetical protein